MGKLTFATKASEASGTGELSELPRVMFGPNAAVVLMKLPPKMTFDWLSSAVPAFAGCSSSTPVRVTSSSYVLAILPRYTESGAVRAQGRLGTTNWMQHNNKDDCRRKTVDA